MAMSLGTSALVVSSAFLFVAAMPAQVLMEGSGPGRTVRIFNTDSAILESQEPRKDLPCTVVPIKADLGFDLKFHAGYDVSIPLKELSGVENLLTMIFPRGAQGPAR